MLRMVEHQDYSRVGDPSAASFAHATARAAAVAQRRRGRVRHYNLHKRDRSTEPSVNACLRVLCGEAGMLEILPDAVPTWTPLLVGQPARDIVRYGTRKVRPTIIDDKLTPICIRPMAVTSSIVQ
jgi:hypothetical protein